MRASVIWPILIRYSGESKPAPSPERQLHACGPFCTPPPPISVVLATNAKVYVTGLTDYRNDNLIEWCRLFTAALRTAANHAASLGERLTELQDSWRRAAGRPRRDSAAEKLIQTLPARPILDANVAAEIAGRQLRSRPVGRSRIAGRRHPEADPCRSPP